MGFSGARNACQGWVPPGAIALLLYHHFAPFCSSPHQHKAPQPFSLPIFSLLTSPGAVVLQLIAVNRLLAVRSLPRRTEQIPP